ncbi:MAG: DNA mismatch repair endonuclease MutL [Desulforhopalus sp.]
MSKIRILPEQLANQIAAGEVVERPASVIKELVENSLDAGATRIEVEVEGAGTRLLRVIDNGEGMSEDDLLMSIERHGTSKIMSEEDLGAIGTLGFRGEAVPSIGSVSLLTITSRPAAKELGTQVVLKYGKLTRVHDTGCSFGTTVEVRNLFGNTPARRKFLRTARTELGHIEEIVKDYALGSPEVAFNLRSNGRDSLYLDTTQTVQQRLAHIMRYEGEFIPVGSKHPTAAVRHVTGYLIPPEKVTSGPARLRIFVNGRAVRDRMISHGVTEGMRNFLMKGKNPSGLIHLVLPPDEVDVNVHPAKHEVRFRNSRDVHELLSQAVAKAMFDYQKTVQIEIFGRDRVADRTAIPVEHDNIEKLSPGTDHSVSPPFPFFPEQHFPVSETSSEFRIENTGFSSPSPGNIPGGQISQNQPLFTTSEPIHQSNQVYRQDDHKAEITPQYTPQRHNLLVIGQFDDLYIFCKSSEGLVVIDQHAAHERLLFEKYRRQYLDKKVIRQNLMFPETIELSLFQAQLVEKNSEQLDRMGFSFREFGGNTYIISAVPALAGITDPRELFLDILEQFGSEDNKSNKGDTLDSILSRMACKAAVKAGTALSREEIDKLLDDMARADLFSHCPHGRPVVKRFPATELKKWFYRT